MLHPPRTQLIPPESEETLELWEKFTQGNSDFNSFDEFIDAVESDEFDFDDELCEFVDTYESSIDTYNNDWLRKCIEELKIHNISLNLPLKENGHSPLVLSILKNNSTAVLLLLENGADISYPPDLKDRFIEILRIADYKYLRLNTLVKIRQAFPEIDFYQIIFNKMYHSNFYKDDAHFLLSKSNTYFKDLKSVAQALPSLDERSLPSVISNNNSPGLGSLILDRDIMSLLYTIKYAYIILERLQQALEEGSKNKELSDLARDDFINSQYSSAFHFFKSERKKTPLNYVFIINLKLLKQLVFDYTRKKRLVELISGHPKWSVIFDNPITKELASQKPVPHTMYEEWIDFLNMEHPITDLEAFQKYLSYQPVPAIRYYNDLFKWFLTFKQAIEDRNHLTIIKVVDYLIANNISINIPLSRNMNILTLAQELYDNNADPEMSKIITYLRENGAKTIDELNNKDSSPRPRIR